MKKVTVLLLLGLLTLPIIGQQHRMSMDATFDKNKKCLTFTFKNNCINLNAAIRNGNPRTNAGSIFWITVYNKDNSEIGCTNSTFHPGGLSIIFRPEEIKKTTINLKNLMDRDKNEYIADLNGIYKIEIHCLVRSLAYAEKIEGTYERYEKDYTFYWE